MIYAVNKENTVRVVRKFSDSMGRYTYHLQKHVAPYFFNLLGGEWVEEWLTYTISSDALDGWLKHYDLKPPEAFSVEKDW